MNNPDVTDWDAIDSTHVIGQYFFEVTVTGESYLKMFNIIAFPRISHIFESKNMFSTS